MKKILSTVLILITLFTSQAFAATSSDFGSNQYCTATISQKLTSNKKYKTASVKITTYDMSGKKTSGIVNVKLTDNKGNYIGTYKKQSGDTIKLGNDHSGYRIYISAYEKPVKGFWGFIAAGDNFINLGKCAKWKVANNKDCYIK